ncbi:MAG: chorismate synthase [Ruminococcaceae bacterium]|nr:chorismate synthase [Oscillospiraceae bacterium]
MTATLFGESHGPPVVAVLDGRAPGLVADMAAIGIKMAKRRAGVPDIAPWGGWPQDRLLRMPANMSCQRLILCGAYAVATGFIPSINSLTRPREAGYYLYGQEHPPLAGAVWYTPRIKCCAFFQYCINRRLYAKFNCQNSLIG